MIRYAEVHIPLSRFDAARFNPSIGVYDAPIGATMARLQHELATELSRELQAQVVPMVSFFSPEEGEEGIIHGRVYDSEGEELEIFQQPLRLLVADALERAASAAREKVDHPSPIVRVYLPRYIGEEANLSYIAWRLKKALKRDYAEGVLALYLSKDNSWKFEIETEDVTDRHYKVIGDREKEKFLLSAENFMGEIDAIEGDYENQPI